MNASRFDFSPLPLAGLVLIQRKLIKDRRGFFSRFFCVEEFREAGLHKAFTQLNHTLTLVKGAVRGLHFQRPPHAEVKIVSCLKGKIFDVAVDIRKGSPTFLNWHGEILSADNQKSILIPEGFAHGLQTLSQDCELIYLHTEAFHPEAEGAINIFDPRLNISWPIPITDLSERDRSHPFIGPEFLGISI